MELYWIWLGSLKYIGPVLQKALIKKFGNPKAVFEASKLDYSAIPNLNKRALQSIITNKCLGEAEKILEEARKKDIKLLCFDDPCYPADALQCPESPVLLYYKGTLNTFTNSVAVVGSRRCTAYGRKVALEIGRELALRGIPVISGFAKGIDSYAQAACGQNGGYLIGFLANGVDICYPKEQRNLYEQLLASGSAFISQYPPGTKPNFKYFLQRNALISAWSKEIIIVEATENSGALWTKQFAKSFGRRILAVPNQIGIPEGVGTNKLIADGEAVPYLGVHSLDSVSSCSHINQEREMRQSPKETNKMLAFITKSPKSINEISQYLQKDEQETLKELLNLELEGRITIRGSKVTLN